MISGVRGPYAYLPASVERFPSPDEMLGRMRQAGFREVSWTPYTFGVAGLYRGVKESRKSELTAEDAEYTEEFSEGVLW